MLLVDYLGLLFLGLFVGLCMGLLFSLFSCTLYKWLKFLERG